MAARSPNMKALSVISQEGLRNIPTLSEGPGSQFTGLGNGQICGDEETGQSLFMLLPLNGTPIDDSNVFATADDETRGWFRIPPAVD